MTPAATPVHGRYIGSRFEGRSSDDHICGIDGYGDNFTGGQTGDTEEHSQYIISH